MNLQEKGMFRYVVPDFSRLYTFPAVLLQIDVTDLPDAPWFSNPNTLTTVTQTRHHFIHLKRQHKDYNNAIKMTRKLGLICSEKIIDFCVEAL